MIKWYDSSGNYVGYASPVNGLIHYFSSDNAGVITDLGVTKPVSFDTTCCDSGAAIPDYVPMQAAASVLGVNHAALGTFVGTPSSTLSFTNTDTVRTLQVIFQVGTNFEISVPDAFWATDRFVTELSVNGGAYSTVYNQQILAGGNYAGNTVGVQNSVSIDRLSALTVLPGATLTLTVRSTTVVLQRTTLAGSIANNTVLRAWGHYI